MLIFTEGTSASSNDCLDPSSEGWIADCFNDADMHFCNEDMYVFADFPSSVKLNHIPDKLFM